MATETSGIKRAQPNHPVLDVIVERWSPYLFNDQPVETGKLLSCLEAARWAASSYNEQPWTYIVARREDTAAFDLMISCLAEANQAWARHAGVLIITAVSRLFSRNEKPNRVAEHDLGLAAGNLVAQATTLGLHVHQMAGINIERAREVYQVPENHDPHTGIAIGYAADPASADSPEEKELAQRDIKPRTRKPLNEWVYEGVWNRPARIVQ